MDNNKIANAFAALRVCLWLFFSASIASGASAALTTKYELLNEPTAVGFGMLLGIGSLVVYILLLIKANKALKELEQQFRS